jgi:hypothetical protein
LALLAPRASADTPFSSFAFPATGAPTARTLPDRLGELKNVKDFGARGNGSTNDTAAIQAAVNQGGNIVFPGGTYNISSPIIISGDEGYVSLIGDGNVVLQWAGKTAGWMIDRPSGGEGKSVIIEGIYFRNMAWWLGPNNGCVRMKLLSRLTIRDCYFECRNCIKTDYLPEFAGGGVHGTAIERCHFRGVVDPNIQDRSRNWGSDSTAIEINGYAQTLINLVDINGFNKGIAVPAGAASIKNARIEMVDYGVDGSNLILENLQMEANFISFLRVGNAIARNVFCLGDGWENNGPDGHGFPDGVGVTVGIDIVDWTEVYLDNVTVTGFFSEAAIKFAPGAPPQKSVFIRVFGDANKSRPQNANSVDWKNFVSSSNQTYIQCNHP